MLICLRHVVDLSGSRPPHCCLEVRIVDRVLLLPLQDGIEAAAHVLVVKVGEWHLLDIHPVV